MMKEVRDAEAASEAAKVPYRIEAKEGKILLTVFPGHGREDLVERVLKDLAGRGYLGMDEVRIEEAIGAASGEPVEIGGYTAKDAEAHVEISPDGLEARLLLSPPDPDGKPLTFERAMAALTEAGVKEGIDETAVREMVEGGQYGVARVVARGRKVEDGEDGWIEYHFDTERKVRLKMDEDTGQVDHKELGLVQNVVEGQLLATLHPPKEGTPGLTVKGEYIPPRPGKEAKLQVGKGAVLSPDGKEIRAELNGQVALVAGKVTVSPVYVVKGDVGASTGNINFLGTVEVHGSIEDGYVVKATEGIVVQKTVGKAHLEAGGNVEIRGGVAGHNEGFVRSGGDVQARFLQEARVEAKGDVIVQDAIMHSTVEAGGRVLVGVGPVASRKGTIVGGQVRALYEVNCRSLGSPMSTKSSVEVGVSPRVLRRIEELSAELKKDKENFDRVRKGILALKTIKARLGGNLPEDKEKILRSLLGAQEGLKTKLADSTRELDELEAQAQVKVAGKISVADEAHPGVRIGIGAASLYLTESYKFVTFYEEEGEIRHRTYEEPKTKKTDKKKGAKA